jgi:hypothetical protein
VSSHYQVYVSHRIGEIQTLTEPHEWRFVPGRLNPADAATRSQMEEEEIPSLWLDGPAFLHEEDPAWPKGLATDVRKGRTPVYPRPSEFHSRGADDRVQLERRQDLSPRYSGPNPVGRGVSEPRETESTGGLF